MACILKSNFPSPKKLISNFLIFLSGLLIIMGSVTLRNYLVEKDLVLIAGNTGISFYIGNNPQATGTFSTLENISLNQEDMFRDAEIIARGLKSGQELKTSAVSKFWMGKAAGFIHKEPLKYLKLFCKKIALIISPQEFVHDMEYHYLAGKLRIFKILFMDLRLIGPLAILGIILALKSFRETFLLYIALFSISLSIAIFLVSARYRIAIVPFLIIFASFAIFNLAYALRRKNYVAFGLLTLALIFAFFVSHYIRVRSAPFKTDSLFERYLTEAMKYENNSEYRKALEQLNLALVIKPISPRAIFRLAVIYYRLNDLKTAEEKFKEVIKINKFSVDSYYNLGLIYNQQGRFLEAKDMLKEAVYLYPKDARVHFELGLAYKNSGDCLSARQEFVLALKQLNRWRTEDRVIIEAELAGLAR